MDSFIKPQIKFIQVCQIPNEPVAVTVMFTSFYETYISVFIDCLCIRLCNLRYIFKAEL